MADALRGLRDCWRIMWKLGGPLGVVVYSIDGSIDRRIAEIHRRG